MRSKMQELAKTHADERCPGIDETDIVWSMCFDDYVQGARALLSEIEKMAYDMHNVSQGFSYKAVKLSDIKSLFEADTRATEQEKK